jgi:hypothetical protein
MNFKHTGKLGDIIMSLPFIVSMGGGNLYIEIGVNDGWTTMMDQTSFDDLKSLLEIQPYITGVFPYNGEHIDYDLNRFREVAHKTFFGNLAEHYFIALNEPVKFDFHSYPWISTGDIKYHSDKKICVSHTGKYLFNTPDKNEKYNDFIPYLPKQGFFVGTSKEHQEFQSKYGVELEFRPCSNFLDLARHVESAELFLGNQGFICTLAEGLKKTMILEIRKDDGADHCKYNRGNLFLF